VKCKLDFPLVEDGINLGQQRIADKAVGGFDNQPGGIRVQGQLTQALEESCVSLAAAVAPEEAGKHGLIVGQKVGLTGACGGG
jgi:hypothetical protein